MGTARHPYSSIENAAPGHIGCGIVYFEEAGSTQDIARGLADDGAPQGTVVIAEMQTAGRGRMGRRWHSPPGLNLYNTIILRPSMALAEVPRLSLVAGIAAAEALEPIAPGIVQLKWPNDIWLNGRKAGGLIAEAVTDSGQHLKSVLLGIGLNLNLSADQLPPELRAIATSVKIATGKSCDRVAIAKALYQRLDDRYTEFHKKGFAPMKAAWEKYSALTGREVTVVDAGTRERGTMAGIDADGAMILETAAGRKRIIAGDVTLEGAYQPNQAQPRN